MELVKMKKIEIVVDNTHLKMVLDILESSGVSGYTVIKDIIGKGDRGLVLADEPFEGLKNSYLFTVCNDEIANSVIARIGPLLKRYGGACMVSDVGWLVY
ncbi:MAG: transcriptional regulator [Aquificaceae bacterium]|nr:transcriptional regulator [Aquificaceae bacterium]MDW8236981.1 P-II family nitrogen regulator [Aquificaceae bacterium]